MRKIDPKTRRGSILTSLALLVMALAPGSRAAEATVAADALSLSVLQSTEEPQSLLRNSVFAPPSNAGPAHRPFLGKIVLPETRMVTTPGALKTAKPLDRDPGLFPAVEIAFFTDGTDLVPFSEKLILAGSAGRGNSYWDLLVQPGSVWSQRDENGWSRAGFPFALVNALEGETHNGVASFAYRDGKITKVRLQVVQETAPFYVTDYFTAVAQVTGRLVPADVHALPRLRASRRAATAARVPLASWSVLETKVGADVLRNFDDGKTPDIVASGLDYQGTLYMKPCETVAGELPWCDRARFGVWSATKALVDATALLRLAQKYGPGIFEEKIADFVPEARDHGVWASVRFGDAINMATGMGNGTPTASGDILEGTLDEYAPWYEARSRAQKVQAIVRAARPYPWKPGEVSRYRDQDMFLLGAAMDAYVKRKEGPSHGVWSLLTTEVYEPIGIHDVPMNMTLEPDGSVGLPLMAYGFFPTLPDIVRIARLYQNLGANGGRQILYAPRIKEILRSAGAPGLPTGRVYPSGETRYFDAFWETAYRSGPHCAFYYPQMEGWGGTEIALFPRGAVGIRIAKIWEDGGNDASNTSGMAGAVDRIASLCP